MKKSIVLIALLAVIILLEAVALMMKSKNPDPEVFALDMREYDLPEHKVKIAPLVFETDFVAKNDAELNDLADELDNGFGVHLAQIFNRLTLAQQQAAEEKAERARKLDAFKQVLDSEPVAVRGAYLGENLCEVDGVRGICADGVYKLGRQCIACYDGMCGGTTCADEVEKTAEEIATDESEVAVEEEVEAEQTEEPEPAVEAEEPEVVAPESVVETITVADEPEAADTMEDVLGEKIEMPEEALAEVPHENPVEKEVVVEEKAVVAAEKTTEPAAEDNAVLVAVVIDDIGLSVPFTNQIAEIGYPITVSFLPYGASNKHQVTKLKNAGLEVMLHVPMMPRVPADLAPVTLSPKMPKAEIQEKLTTMIERFEGTGMGGVNNHMGSAFTENREAMGAVMEILQKRGMFFLDSKTTARSIGRAAAKEYGVPYVARDVFLDNERRYDYIMGQFKETERTARRQGYAIAIGHPYPQTLQALKDWLKDTEKRGIKVVPLSDLVKKLN